MAIGKLRALGVLLALLSLGSCQVLAVVFGSVFPSTTTLAKAQVDLSSLIPSGGGSSFYVRVVETGSYGYVVVTGNPQSGNEAFFYDLDLNQKASFTGGLAGNAIMVDTSGYIVLGNLLLNPANLTIVGTTNAAANIRSYSAGGVDGFVDPGGNDQVANFTLSADTLSYSTYTTTWTFISTPITTISSNLSGLQIDAILDDGNPSGNVTFVVGPSPNNNIARCYFFSTEKRNFAVPLNVLDASPVFRDNLYPSSIGYAQGSIFAYDSGSGSFVRMDPSTGSIMSSFYYGGDPKNIRYGYRASGGAFYGFDQDTRVLTKYGQWW